MRTNHYNAVFEVLKTGVYKIQECTEDREQAMPPKEMTMLE